MREAWDRISRRLAAKIGRCSKCMRWSLQGAVLGWIAVGVMHYFWRDATPWRVILLWPVGFTGLWLLHVGRFAGATAARSMVVAQSVGMSDDAALRSPVTENPTGRRGFMVSIARGAALAIFVSLPLLARRSFAACVQLPIGCSQNSDCTCSNCCGSLNGTKVCQPSC